MLIVCGHAWCLPFDVAAEAARPLDARDDAAAFWRDALVFKQIDTGMRKPGALALRCNGKVRAQCPVSRADRLTAHMGSWLQYLDRRAFREAVQHPQELVLR